LEEKQGVCQTEALPFTLKKSYLLKAKEEELWKLKYYFTMQKYTLIFKKKKSPLKETKILQDIIIITLK
jgi:hypothetical protein